jgi:DNA-binding NtrC family response regulator
VVLVDDDSDIRDSFERLLGECDLETYVAKSALRALQILGERHVDAVVTDQVMPGLDGLGLLELVSARFPSCTRILCTAYPGSDVVIDAVNCGRVHRVLTKTMHAVALRDEIERAVLEAVHARDSRHATEPERPASDDR